MSEPHDDVKRTPAQSIGLYVALRDRIKQEDDAYKEKMKPKRELLERLNNELLGQLNDLGGDNIKTPYGTAYRSEKKSATIADGQGFRDFVIANDLFDMVDWKANAGAVNDYIQEYGEPPPGVNYTTVFVVGVRRPGEK